MITTTTLPASYTYITVLIIIMIGIVVKTAKITVSDDFNALKIKLIELGNII